MLLTLYSSECPYGKVDKSSFSTETLMDTLVSGISDAKAITRDAHSFKHWNGLVFADNSNDVVEILWESLGLEGTLHLESLPESLQIFNACENSLHGTIELNGLPEFLREFNVFSNKLSGTLALTRLPSSLNELSLSINRFYGSVDLTKLPPSLRVLTLYENELVGCIDLTKLPRAMKGVYLHLNNFEGSVSIDNLPSTLTIINLAYNANLVGVVHEKAHKGVDIIVHDTSITYIEESE